MCTFSSAREIEGNLVAMLGECVVPIAREPLDICKVSKGACNQLGLKFKYSGERRQSSGMIWDTEGTWYIEPCLGRERALDVENGAEVVRVGAYVPRWRGQQDLSHHSHHARLHCGRSKE